MMRASARKSLRTAIAILAMGLSALGLIACGQGGELRQFISRNEGQGYSIEYPVDWSVKTEQPVKGASDNRTTDDFISADQKATVSVGCVSVPQVNTIDEFLQNELNGLKVGGFGNVKVERNGLIVAGTPAPELDYTFTTGGSTTYFTTVLAFNDCGWFIMYTSTSEAGTYRYLFEQMARSFTPG